MQAIQVKYIPATNTKPSRIKAWADRGSITLSYPSCDSNPAQQVAKALQEKFIKEDEAKYGSTRSTNPWAWPMIQAGLPGNNGDVFVSARELLAVDILKELVTTCDKHRWKTNSDETDTIKIAKKFIKRL